MHAIYQCAKPVIFAHRGASMYAPENTIAAFDLAKDQGAVAIELDTMLSQDGIPVVIHDRQLKRTTNGSGLVDQLPYEQLSRLDAGSSFSKSFKNERIPRLEDVLIRYRDNLIINIELKNLHSPHDWLCEIVVKMVDDLELTQSVIYSSFLPANLKKVKKISSESKTALLCPNGLIGKVYSTVLFPGISEEFIHLNVKDINAGRIRSEHRKNRRVHAWTVNDRKIAEQLIRIGVDGIMTDDPAALLTSRINEIDNSDK